MYSYLNSSFQISDYRQYSHIECDYSGYKYLSPDATVPICVCFEEEKEEKISLLGGEEGEYNKRGRKDSI